MYLLKPDIIHPLDLLVNDKVIKQNPLDHLVKIEDVCFSDYPDDKFTKEELERYWNKNQVILLDEGFLIFQPYPDHTNIEAIAVLPEYRGQGIAKILISKLGPIKLTLHCREVDRPFYEHLDFQEYGITENYYKNGEKAIKMLKPAQMGILDLF